MIDCSQIHEPIETREEFAALALRLLMACNRADSDNENRTKGLPVESASQKSTYGFIAKALDSIGFDSERFHSSGLEEVSFVDQRGDDGEFFKTPLSDLAIEEGGGVLATISEFEDPEDGKLYLEFLGSDNNSAWLLFYAVNPTVGDTRRGIRVFRDALEYVVSSQSCSPYVPTSHAYPDDPEFVAAARQIFVHLASSFGRVV